MSWRNAMQKIRVSVRVICLNNDGRRLWWYGMWPVQMSFVQSTMWTEREHFIEIPTTRRKVIPVGSEREWTTGRRRRLHISWHNRPGIRIWINEEHVGHSFKQGNVKFSINRNVLTQITDGYNQAFIVLFKQATKSTKSEACERQSEKARWLSQAWETLQNFIAPNFLCHPSRSFLLECSKFALHFVEERIWATKSWILVTPTSRDWNRALYIHLIAPQTTGSPSSLWVPGATLSYLAN